MASGTHIYASLKARRIQQEIKEMLDEAGEPEKPSEIIFNALTDYQAKIKRKLNKKVSGE
ncbi:MAG: hypothetical protein ACRCYD_01790 [Plesiomonas sp.]